MPGRRPLLEQSQMQIESFAGFGLGMRRPHYRSFIEGKAQVDFIEVISENYMVEGGRPLVTLDAVRRNYPVILHGVSMSVGSAHGLDLAYLKRLKDLARRIDPLWVSDHLCWTRTSAHNSHDLLPLPYTQEALDLVCSNIAQAQDILGRALLFENPSSYVTFSESEMSESEFLAAMVRRTGCYLLLDVNNVYVSALNHGFDARSYIAELPLDRVRQIHLAGHQPGDIIVDTHDRAVCEAVWDIYAWVMPQLGPVATMLERDDAIPPLDELVFELDRARDTARAASELVA